LGARGEPIKNQPGERSEFWKVFDQWRDEQRKPAPDKG